MTEPTETVDLVGVRANGEHVNLGKVAKPPRMKAREIAQSYFGPFQDDDGSESDACFGALEELIDWLVKQGWTPPQPTQAQAGAVPLTYQQVIAAWNAQADEHNQWDALGEDEKIEWAVACAKAAPLAVVEPLTDEQIEREWQFLHDEEGNQPDHSDFARAIESAHGIGIKKGDSHG